ncbi:MAG: ATP-binding protein [Candidatus Nitrosotenuis sp.]
MSDKKGGVIINNEVSDPTGNYVIDYLLSQKKETTFHDFKWTLDVTKNSQDFPKIIKDVYAFSNYGGGWLVLGVKENDYSDDKIKGKYIKSGLPEEYNLEDASLQEKINSYLDEPIAIQYVEFARTINEKERRFALVYIPPSSKLITTKEDVKYKVGNKEKIAVQKETVYTRRGTQSIIASDYEKELIKKRLEKEKYRLSILSGEPEEIHENIYSNLFEVKKLPQTIYFGIAKYNSFQDALEAVQKAHPQDPHFSLKYRQYEDKIVTFENLDNPMNIHREIVHTDTITQESVADWLEDEDKEKIIVALLNKEVTDKARRQGMRYDSDSRKLYYPMHPDNKERKEEWPSRYKGLMKKQVAKKSWSDALNRTVYLHAAIRTAIMKIGSTFYLRLNLTMVVTEDGKKPISGIKEGAIITGETYRIYNKGQLNLILFWINKLGDGQDVFVIRDFLISHEPVETSMEIGISWDIPTSDFKQIIEEYDAEVEQAKEEAESDLEETTEENYVF